MRISRRIFAFTLLSFILASGSIAPPLKTVCTTTSATDDQHPTVLIDESRGVSSDLSFGLLSEILLNAGFRVESVNRTTDLFPKLSAASVLMLPPSRYGLDPTQRDIIIDFVTKGGGLLIVGEVKYDLYVDLARKFGITMLPGIVCDPYLSTPIKPFHIKIIHMQQHPVTENVNAFTYDWGQPFVVNSPALSLATAGNGSWYETDSNGVKDPNEQSGQFSVLASSEYSKGRVVAVGDVGCFALYRRLQWSPLQDYDTARLALNMFNWLAKTDRNGPSLEYTVNITNDLAEKHVAHIDLQISGYARSELKLILSRWQDGMHYYAGITNLVASTSRSSLNVTEGEEKGTKIWGLKVNSENVTVKYDVRMDYFRKDLNGYVGYLGLKFGTCQAAQLFLVPANMFFSKIVLRCKLPSEWEVYGPWRREADGLAPDAARAAMMNYGPTSGMKAFLFATIGFGRFVAQSKTIGQTEVEVVCWAGWAQSVREIIWKSSFDIYDYMTTLFGTPAPQQKYMALWTPLTEDGKGITQIEWASSQALNTAPPEYAFSNYAHRLFHIWNAWDPTGMKSESNSEQWIVEGMNTYYNYKALVELGLLKKGRILISEYGWYAREIVGTKFDVALTESFKYGNRSDFDQYIWLLYRKGALVWYVLDTVIQSVTNDTKSLNHLQKVMYDQYGGCRSSYSTKDVQKHLETITGYSFQSLFDNYVYGTTRLPLFLQGEQVLVNHTALGLTSKPATAITQIKTTSPTVSISMTKSTGTETKKEPEKATRGGIEAVATGLGYYWPPILAAVTIMVAVTYFLIKRRKHS